VLAAGRGWRMGGPKALMSASGMPWWRLQALALDSIGVRGLWVVNREVFAAMGADAPRAVIADADAPMFESIRTGIAALQAEPIDAVFILPVDVPAPRRAVWESVAAQGAPLA
jgi:CTP:molybdopterin cytidylyltransferase MocA